MGKWTAIAGKLPKFPGSDLKYQDKVAAGKLLILADMSELAGEEVTHLSAVQLAKMVVNQRTVVAEAKAAESAANLTLEALQQMLVQQYEDEDVSSLKVAGAAVRTQIEPYAQVKDKEKHRQWCISEGLEESMVLPWGTTNSITKTRLEQGLSEPDGVEAFQKSTVVVTRDKT